MILSLHSNTLIEYNPHRNYIMCRRPMIDINPVHNQLDNRYTIRANSNGLVQLEFRAKEVKYPFLVKDNRDSKRINHSRFTTHREAILYYLALLDDEFWGLDQSKKPIRVNLNKRVYQELNHEFMCVRKDKHIHGINLLARFIPGDEFRETAVFFYIEYEENNTVVCQPFGSYLDLIEEVYNILDRIPNPYARKRCQSCRSYLGETMNNIYLHCAFYPYGMDAQECNDYTNRK